MNPVPDSAAPSDLLEDCFAVLLPAVGDFGSHEWLAGLLRGGTVAVLLGETRQEYVDRGMSQERQKRETSADVQSFVGELVQQTTSQLLVALDQEPWGIQRLHRLVPSYPSVADLGGLSLDALEQRAYEVAVAAKRLGVSVFLSPVLDVLEGPNPWLHGRTLQGFSRNRVCELAAAFVAGTRRGGVAAVAKHFPGFPELSLDPALDARSTVPLGRWNDRCLEPFEAAVRAGAAGVMVGPAVIEDVDPIEPAATSASTVALLRQSLRFDGMVVSDDLDAPATLKGRTLTDTMIGSLSAGADLLLVGGGDHVADSVQSLFREAAANDGLATRIHAAAAAVRRAAAEFGIAAGDGSLVEVVDDVASG